jgi:nicotinate dehydrogenase subunit A
MADPITLSVNGRSHTLSLAPETPLLYVLRNDLELNGAKFGCGLAQCGACTVIADGAPIRSCVTALGDVAGREVATIEGLGTVDKPHPLQKAFIELQAAQCGYCINGMVMSAKALLDQSPHASNAEIREALAGNLCRCGTHTRILRAIEKAQKEMAT